MHHEIGAELQRTLAIGRRRCIDGTWAPCSCARLDRRQVGDVSVIGDALAEHASGRRALECEWIGQVHRSHVQAHELDAAVEEI
jgi:hypothetical protein